MVDTTTVGLTSESYTMARFFLKEARLFPPFDAGVGFGKNMIDSLEPIC